VLGCEGHRTVIIHQELRGTPAGSSSGVGSGNRRATRAIDIFSLGCVFYYVLTRGSHPFDKNGKFWVAASGQDIVEHTTQ
jgi:serine/threonine protein kinase